MAKQAAPQTVEGANLLYHYLQKDLQESNVWLAQMVIADLVTRLGVWLHPDAYRRVPIMLPFVVRDASCRKRKAGETESWGAPDERGYLRDDNSLLKGLPKSLCISAPKQPLYDGKRMGGGFTTAHVWRQASGSSVGTDSAARDPWTNSFVPNLVWLPSEVAKLTDREGSFSQRFIQALSAKIYRDVDVGETLHPIVERTWGMLEIPATIPPQGLPDPADLAYFMPTDAFVSHRMAKIAEVIDALELVVQGRPLDNKVVTGRYGDGLPAVDSGAARSLRASLSEYSAALSSADSV